jgi:hypothetical protein
MRALKCTLLLISALASLVSHVASIYLHRGLTTDNPVEYSRDIPLIETLLGKNLTVAVMIMDFDKFLTSIDDEKPSLLLSETLTSLWWDKKGDWNTAHSIAQKILTVQGSAVHAYLHREEGVLWNADYWYSRAGRKRPSITLEEEWKSLVKEMLESL